MNRLQAEVVGLFDQPGDCSKLLYSPLDVTLSYRRTRLYELEFEGSEHDARAFVERVLVDQFAEEVHFGEAAALSGQRFILDYGMRPGVLDLEREAILNFHHGTRSDALKISKLTLTQRLYVFADGDGGGAEPARFIKDVCNPAIHHWKVTEEADARDTA